MNFKKILCQKILFKEFEVQKLNFKNILNLIFTLHHSILHKIHFWWGKELEIHQASTFFTITIFCLFNSPTISTIDWYKSLKAPRIYIQIPSILCALFHYQSHSMGSFAYHTRQSKSPFVIRDNWWRVEAHVMCCCW